MKEFSIDYMVGDEIINFEIGNQLYYIESNYGEKYEYCKECKRYEECFAGCRAASEQLGMGLEHADPILKFD